MICEICGKAFDKLCYSGDFKNICSNECFDKKYWNQIIKDKNNRVIIDGTVYWYDKTEPIKGIRGQFLGFCGRLFTIRYKTTGEIVKTNSLWHNGVVPEWCKDQLPDNAEFVKERFNNDDDF